jgi:hypothetical protein
MLDEAHRKNNVREEEETVSEGERKKTRRRRGLYRVVEKGGKSG